MQDFDSLQTDVVRAAQRLLGCIIVHESNGQRVAGKIVETEAYHQTDAASHSYNGQTPRTEVMFRKAGVLYVYFTYGMHYCMNIVTGVEGEGSAVLIRALEPLEGREIMKRNRRLKIDNEIQLTNGPAKSCQAFGIDKRLNGHNLTEPPLTLEWQPPVSEDDIVQTTRIGISRDTHRPWRFYIKDNAFVSKQ